MSSQFIRSLERLIAILLPFFFGGRERERETVEPQTLLSGEYHDDNNEQVISISVWVVSEGVGGLKGRGVRF